MYGLCDCNNFYVSCERIFDPSLEGRAVAILSGNDGCIIARSNEAKALGLEMGQPLFKAKELIAKHNIKLFSGNIELYGDISQRVMATLRANLPSIEVYSIDEAFLELGGIDTSTLKSFGESLSRRVRRNTGIPVSIGMAPTKTLAKVATRLCKQYPKLNSACLLYRDEDIEKVLRRYSIRDVWGIGRRHSLMLTTLGIETAWDFVCCKEEWVRCKMQLPGVKIWRELRGIPSIDFDDTQSTRKSISVSRSFAKETSNKAELRGSIADFTTKAAEKLRRQGSTASALEVKIETNRHRGDQPQRNVSHLMEFDPATDSTLEMVRAAAEALSLIYREGFGYKKAGVRLHGIKAKMLQQSTLFDPIDRDKHTKLMQVVDKLNSATGERVVSIASSSGKREINCKHRSPRYTTQWSDILKIKV